ITLLERNYARARAAYLYQLQIVEALRANPGRFPAQFNEQALPRLKQQMEEAKAALDGGRILQRGGAVFRGLTDQEAEVADNFNKMQMDLANRLPQVREPMIANSVTREVQAK